MLSFFLLFLPFLFASLLSTHFSHILFLNPRYFHLGLSGSGAVDALISFVFVMYPSLASCFFILFIIVPLVLLSDYDRKTRLSCNSGVLQQVLLSVIHENCVVQF